MRADHDQICLQIGRQLRDFRGDGVEAHVGDHATDGSSPAVRVQELGERGVGVLLEARACLGDGEYRQRRTVERHFVGDLSAVRLHDVHQVHLRRRLLAGELERALHGELRRRREIHAHDDDVALFQIGHAPAQA